MLQKHLVSQTSRIQRIFPLYYLAIGLIFVVMYVCLPESSYDINTNSGMRAIFLLTNMKSELDPEQDYAKLVGGFTFLFKKFFER